MKVAGIDLSTHAIDIVTIPYDGTAAPEWHRYPLNGPTSFDRARTVRDAMPARTSSLWDEVIAVGIEDPRGMAAGHAYRVQGGILACLPRPVLVTPWIPSQWRKAVGLAGNASKCDVMTQVLVEQPDVAYDWPQDACDAYCIALATRQAISIGQAA